ncbi:hypothetical protein HBB16_10075 [Pseudonocardia sp. MCCB 268]|nr:hypothetical protein [Pseudonocardia cytotoxica]
MRTRDAVLALAAAVVTWCRGGSRREPGAWRSPVAGPRSAWRSAPSSSAGVSPASGAAPVHPAWWATTWPASPRSAWRLAPARGSLSARRRVVKNTATAAGLAAPLGRHERLACPGRVRVAGAGRLRRGPGLGRGWLVPPSARQAIRQRRLAQAEAW